MSSPSRVLDEASMSASTHQIFVEPNAFAVGLPDEHVVLCHEVLGQAGLRLHRHEHPALAGERITRLMPRIVVVDAALPGVMRELVEERSIAIGAVIVTLYPHQDLQAVEHQLVSAVVESQERFGRRQPRLD